jgi:hypothetical protein
MSDILSGTAVAAVVLCAVGQLACFFEAFAGDVESVFRSAGDFLAVAEVELHYLWCGMDVETEDRFVLIFASSFRFWCWFCWSVHLWCIILVY